jgi:hypothetical protein
MGIAVIFVGPLLVIDDFVVVPDVVITVVGVIDPFSNGARHKTCPIRTTPRRRPEKVN